MVQRTVFLFLCLLIPDLLLAAVHHDMQVQLFPEQHRIRVQDTITLSRSQGGGTHEFWLHANLKPTLESPGRLRRIARDPGSVPLMQYRLLLPEGVHQFTLTLDGEIYHPLTQQSEGLGKRQAISPGLISADGVVLSGMSGWYPRFESEPMVTFSLHVEAPDGWRTVSQGAGSDDARSWQEAHPQDEIYLIAAPFSVYSADAGSATAMVFLRQPDPYLADTYLAATERYLRLYSDLVGDYPYAKFALVENFWETGYGMPSFTLLGPRVLRLPFIPYTSYPHEILHSWWGNGVYVDYSGGNWSEGFTAYLADHLLKEAQGRGAEYRRDQLQKYANYVAEADDLPLSRFTSRHSEATQAIGYGKTALLFHMLRRKLGDEQFKQGIRQVWRDHQFKTAGWEDIQSSFETVSNVALQRFFQQWVTRTGALKLSVEELQIQRDEGGSGYLLTGQLQQRQSPAYEVNVPLWVLDADQQWHEFPIPMNGDVTRLMVPLKKPALCVAVDPRFELFRALEEGEIPVSLDTVFAADHITIVVPEHEGVLTHGYENLAYQWASSDSRIEVVHEQELTQWPSEGAVIVLGWGNRWVSMFPEGVPEEGLTQDDDWQRKSDVLVITARKQTQPLMFIGTNDPATLPGLARKLPHYGRYGYLAFRGEGPRNRLKGRWPVNESPLKRIWQESAGSCTPPPLAPLINVTLH